MKKCTICGLAKPYTEFHKQASQKDGYCRWCKPCKKIRKAAEYQANREKLLPKMAAYRRANAEKVSEVKKRCYQNKKAQYVAKTRVWYAANREHFLDYCAKRRVIKRESILEKELKYREQRRELRNELQKKYYLEHKDERRAYSAGYRRHRSQNEPLYALKNILRRRIALALKARGYLKKSKTAQMLGCDWQQLSSHLESQFRDGMSWTNRGDWHVDHIVPLASAKTEDELVALCHYRNLQPLWAMENMSKGVKRL